MPVGDKRNVGASQGRLCWRGECLGFKSECVWDWEEVYVRGLEGTLCGAAGMCVWGLRGSV